jgi:hypothetical protein
MATAEPGRQKGQKRSEKTNKIEQGYCGSCRLRRCLYDRIYVCFTFRYVLGCVVALADVKAEVEVVRAAARHWSAFACTATEC